MSVAKKLHKRTNIQIVTLLIFAFLFIKFFAGLAAPFGSRASGRGGVPPPLQKIFGTAVSSLFVSRQHG